MRQLHHALLLLYKVAAVLACILLCIMTLLILWSMIARPLNIYSGDVNLFSAYFMAASMMLAMPYTLISGGHIRVSLIVGHLPPAVRPWIDRIALGILSAVACYMAYYMARLAYVSWDYGDRADGSSAILLWIPQLPMAIGAAIFALSAIHMWAISLVSKDWEHGRTLVNNEAPAQEA